jgi:hypothetical protein
MEGPLSLLLLSAAKGYSRRDNFLEAFSQDLSRKA